MEKLNFGGSFMHALKVVLERVSIHYAIMNKTLHFPILVMACDMKLMEILEAIDFEYPTGHAERVLNILKQKVSF